MSACLDVFVVQCRDSFPPCRNETLSSSRLFLDFFQHATLKLSFAKHDKSFSNSRHDSTKQIQLPLQHNNPWLIKTGSAPHHRPWLSRLKTILTLIAAKQRKSGETTTSHDAAQQRMARHEKDLEQRHIHNTVCHML
ncbi:unnamed protein product [Arabidopsis thaliana]|uniref:Uncharacterized protein n=1 Tax=Arabidopsis thaliana TaxID=3702 RepID=A0A654FMT2_ARATH|nr:unnamed protein product [Arabidopsis thaliana]